MEGCSGSSHVNAGSLGGPKRISARVLASASSIATSISLFCLPLLSACLPFFSEYVVPLKFLAMTGP